MSSINLSPVSSGPLHILPAIAAPSTKCTITCQNVKLGTKVALSAALYGLTYKRYDVAALDKNRPIAQELGSQSATDIKAAQKVIYGWSHTDRVYRTGFAQRNPISGVVDGTPSNPTVSFVIPFANAVAYYKLDAELYRLVQGGVLRVLSAVAS